MAFETQWFEKPLGKVTCNHDSQRRPVKEPDRKQGPYPYYGASGIIDYVNDYLFEGRYLLIAEDGENLRTRKTPIAFIAEGKFWVNNHAHIVTGSEEVSTEYLYYFLQNADIRPHLTGAVMPKLTQESLNSIPVRYPESDYQKEIVRALGALDEKITLNRRINQTLESMAQALFKSWFVYFRDVPREDLQESELGLIPKGWQIKRVDDLLELVYGKALKSTDRKKGTVPVYGSGGITGYHSEALVPHGSIVVGRKGTIGSLYWVDEPFFPIDTTYYIKSKNAPISYCYYAMQSLGLNQMNTDAAVPGLNRDNVYRLKLAVPESNILEEFDKKVTVLRKAIRANSLANKTLATLRDTLLPKLLFGELSISDVTTNRKVS